MNVQIEGHTVKRYDGELSHLHFLVLEMGGLVIEQIRDALTAFKKRDVALAKKVVTHDSEIDRMEVQADHEIMKLLARRCPVGNDLRLVFAVTKSVSDLERIGDQCTNIAKRARELNTEPPLKPYIDLPRMSVWTANMVKESLDAFVKGDAELATKVCQDDQFVDDLNEQIQRELLTFMTEVPRTISRAIKINYISKCLERIADHATNVAEMVIFMVKGKDIRHTIA